MIVRLIGIGGTVSRHCLNLFFIRKISNCKINIFLVEQRILTCLDFTKHIIIITMWLKFLSLIK